MKRIAFCLGLVAVLAFASSAHAGHTSACHAPKNKVVANAYAVVAFSDKSQRKVNQMLVKYKRESLPTGKVYPKVVKSRSVKGAPARKYMLVVGYPSREDVAQELVAFINKRGWKASCIGVEVKNPEPIGLVIVKSTKPGDKTNGDEAWGGWKDVDPWYIGWSSRTSSFSVRAADDNSITIPYLLTSKGLGTRKAYLSVNMGAGVGTPGYWDCNSISIKPPKPGTWITRVEVGLTPANCMMVGD